jgi:hypothetical protein
MCARQAHADPAFPSLRVGPCFVLLSTTLASPMEHQKLPLYHSKRSANDDSYRLLCAQPGGPGFGGNCYWKTGPLASMPIFHLPITRQSTAHSGSGRLTLAVEFT